MPRQGRHALCLDSCCCRCCPSCMSWCHIRVAEDGVKMQGYIGSQLWDTSFAIQGLVEAGLGADPSVRETCRRAYVFIREAQCRTDVDNATQWWRSIQKGISISISISIYLYLSITLCINLYLSFYIDLYLSMSCVYFRFDITIDLSIYNIGMSGGPFTLWKRIRYSFWAGLHGKLSLAPDETVMSL